MELVTNQNHEPLSDREKSLLQRLESDIETNLKGFNIVGEALATIKEQRLYRVDYSTFEEYCLNEWDFSGRRARQLTDCYMVLDNLCTMVHIDGSPRFGILPVNERQARPLTCIAMEQQGEAWTMVLEEADITDSKITALFIQRCVDVFQQKKTTKIINRVRKNGEQNNSLPEPLSNALNDFLGVLQEATKDPDNKKYMVKILKVLLGSLEN